jgi:hypothetical protein
LPGMFEMGLIEEGWMKKIHRIVPALIFFFLFTFTAEVFAVQASAQKPQKELRSPFALPAGIHLRSQSQGVPAAVKAPEKISPPETKMVDMHPSPVPPPLTVKAILISSQSRWALIDRHMVREGDSIGGEKILVIAKDHVVLGRGDKERKLFLHQSPIHLTVEEK